jgi:hypothetical protein
MDHRTADGPNQGFAFGAKARASVPFLSVAIVVFLVADLAMAGAAVVVRLNGPPAPTVLAAAHQALGPVLEPGHAWASPVFPSNPAPAPALPPSAPSRVIIPAIGVSTNVLRLGLNADGSLQVPTTYDVAGWWAGGPSPGTLGPAVIVGHVDSTRGPAVFYRLRDLRPGDRVWVTREDGSRVAFAVQRVIQVPKAAFPTAQVYGAVPYPALRLITCGGAFNHATGHYLDNVIVFAQAI